MKKFMLELLATLIVSLVAVPAVFIGLGIGGTIWGEKVEPWLTEKMKNLKN